MSEALPEDTSQMERLRTFMRLRGVDEFCPACKSEDISLEETAGLVPIVPYFNTYSGTMAPLLLAGLELYVLKCNNCGHVRFFDRQIVDEGTP